MKFSRADDLLEFLPSWVASEASGGFAEPVPGHPRAADSGELGELAFPDVTSTCGCWMPGAEL